jgi:hypothetical protein
MLHYRVANVASTVGSAYLGKCSEEKRNQLLACTTVDQLNNQMKEFVE